MLHYLKRWFARYAVRYAAIALLGFGIMGVSAIYNKVMASEYQIAVQICDDNGANCQPTVWLPSTQIPTKDGWFGVEPNSAEYWEIVTAFGVLMAVVWGSKFLVRFVTGRR